MNRGCSTCKKFREDKWCIECNYEACQTTAKVEQKKGKWIYLDKLDAFECSVCGGQMVRNIFEYCPWCGAYMQQGSTDRDMDAYLEAMDIVQEIQER